MRRRQKCGKKEVMYKELIPFLGFKMEERKQRM
jgi:hypothetical protein